jgi:lipoyl(octanoyl) transferase
MSSSLNQIKYKDLGLIGYKKAWDHQESLFDELMKKKLSGEKIFPGYLLFCEHPHVFTLGKSGSTGNLLIDKKLLEKEGIEFYRINRGGDITYHGPGQIVGYPIIDLEQFGLGIKSYIEILEEAVIKLLEGYSIKSSRLPGATGVWLDAGDDRKARKICAIGVRASRHITMHGFAFNVNTDLTKYRFINPCGFVDKGVTSMAKEIGVMQDMEEVKFRLKEILISMFNETLQGL